MRGREALVVTQVEVGLAAVFGDVDLAVLKRAHRAGVDVDVRVELDEGDVEAAVLEAGRPIDAEAMPLPRRADHATRDEDELVFLERMTVMPDAPGCVNGCLEPGRKYAGDVLQARDIAQWRGFRQRLPPPFPLSNRCDG